MGCAEGKLCYPPTKRDVVLKAIAANDGLIAGAEARINRRSRNSQH